MMKYPARFIAALALAGGLVIGLVAHRPGVQARWRGLGIERHARLSTLGFPYRSGVRQPASVGGRQAAFRGHSHNDYEQAHPLWDALGTRFYSVEADVHFGGEDLVVSHVGWTAIGTLKELYLDPLQDRVDRLGSIYGDGRPFLLWIDLKDDSPGIPAALHRLLSYYPMLSRFGTANDLRAVTVILTGQESPKRRYLELFPERFALRDRLRFRADDEMADEKNPWQWYALNWLSHFEWDGRGTMPLEERAQLATLVAGIHAKGRAVRFWNAPDTREAWETSLEAGVDLISTDSPRELSEFLAKQHGSAAIGAPKPR